MDKEQNRIKCKEWRAKNREKRNEYNKKFMKEWRAKNRERYLQHAREYKRNLSPEKKEQNHIKFRLWYLKNKEYFNEKTKDNYRNHKNEWNTRSLTKYYKQELFNLFDNKCQCCGSIENLEFHHFSYVIPKTFVENLYNLKIITTLLCRSCHRKLHRKSVIVHQQDHCA